MIYLHEIAPPLVTLVSVFTGSLFHQPLCLSVLLSGTMHTYYRYKQSFQNQTHCVILIQQYWTFSPLSPLHSYHCYPLPLFC